MLSTWFVRTPPSTDSYSAVSNSEVSNSEVSNSAVSNSAIYFLDKNACYLRTYCTVFSPQLSCFWEGRLRNKKKVDFSGKKIKIGQHLFMKWKVQFLALFNFLYKKKEVWIRICCYFAKVVSVKWRCKYTLKKPNFEFLR